MRDALEAANMTLTDNPARGCDGAALEEALALVGILQRMGKSPVGALSALLLAHAVILEETQWVRGEADREEMINEAPAKLRVLRVYIRPARGRA